MDSELIRKCPVCRVSLPSGKNMCCSDKCYDVLCEIEAYKNSWEARMDYADMEREWEVCLGSRLSLIL